ncbi:uncharacterized protein LOC133341952 [Lethenteron reissneri]|uniref:uncharacterized protein LOC133341952 n=1 Tax=Lethenteron reissneri TaxID=7753 RepID=UPI002AB64628|nr:uncharacterized protein LOC133341952 [Lethenteron reissneri]
MGVCVAPGSREGSAQAVERRWRQHRDARTGGGGGEPERERPRPRAVEEPGQPRSEPETLGGARRAGIGARRAGIGARRAAGGARRAAVEARTAAGCAGTDEVAAQSQRRGEAAAGRASAALRLAKPRRFHCGLIGARGGFQVCAEFGDACTGQAPGTGSEQEKPSEKEGSIDKIPATAAAARHGPRREGEAAAALTVAWK